MNDSINKLVDVILKAIDTRQAKKPKGYTTQAEVIRVNNGTAWVHIPGGAEETPVQETISCRPGDTVQVHIENGTATLTGNGTAPPTDDKAAERAQETADGAAKVAGEAKGDSEGIMQHFWYMNGSGDEAGAHVTEVDGETFRKKPQGANVLIRAEGIFLRMALTVLLKIISSGLQIFEPTDSTHPSAQFLNTGTVIGKETGAHIIITSGKVEFYLGQYLVGYIEPAGSYLEMSSSGKTFGLTNMASSGQGNYCDIDMDLGHMDLTATQDFKFNSKKMFDTFTATGTVSLNAGSGDAVTCAGTVPTGYTPIAIQAVESDHQQGCLIGRFKLTSNGAGITLRNVSNNNYNNMTVTATILCINSSLL